MVNIGRTFVVYFKFLGDFKKNFIDYFGRTFVVYFKFLGDFKKNFIDYFGRKMKIPLPVYLIKFLDKHAKKKHNTYYVNVRCYFLSNVPTDGKNVKSYFDNKHNHPMIDVFIMNANREMCYAFYLYIDLHFKNQMVRIVTQGIAEGKTQHEAMLDFCQFYDLSEEDYYTDSLRKVYYRHLKSTRFRV